jgi:amino acid transporter
LIATAYRWASVTGGPRYGGVCSWFAGYWLWAAWIVGPASLVSFMALQALAIFETLHPEFVAQDWHVFCSYIVCNCVVCLLVLFADHWLDHVQRFGVFFSLGGWLVSVVICAVGPWINGQAYADSRAVWMDWRNETGWTSDGFVFCLGMLNAALAVGAPDISCHMAEQIPR